MIIELCGLPGGGKTTVVEGLRSKGISFLTRKELLRTGKHTYIDHFLFYITRRGKKRKRLKAILAYAACYRHSTRKYIYKLLALSEALDENRDKDIIMDEGLVQLITSVPYDSSIRPDTLDLIWDSLFKDIADDYHIVYCDIDIKSAEKRILGRGRKDDRYRKAAQSRREELLGIKKKNIELVRDALKDRLAGVYSINMRDAPEVNTEKLSRIFEKSQKNEDVH